MEEYKHYVQMLDTSEGWQVAYPILDQAGQIALPAIRAGLGNSDPQIRKWCVALMDHNADQQSIEALVDCLSDAYADVRRHAVHSIGCQPCKENPLCLDVVGLLIERIEVDPSIRVRRSAVHMLGNQPYQKRAIQLLERLLQTESDPKLLSNAKWALQQQLKDRSVEGLA